MELTELRDRIINSFPRGFGEKFAQTYVQGADSKLKNPSKKIDPNYSGEYDLWLDGITIEVKASRAVDSDSEDPLYMKVFNKTLHLITNNCGKIPAILIRQQLKTQSDAHCHSLSQRP